MSLGAQSSDTLSIQAPVLDIIRPQQESFGNSNRGNKKKIGVLELLSTFQSFSFSKKKQLTPVYRELWCLAEINRKL